MNQNVTALALFSSLALFACKSTPDEPPADAGADVDLRPPTPPDWDRPVTRPNDVDALAGRGSCKYTAGSMPAETLGTSVPVDKDIPIDTVVVVMMENRSFDHYFAHLNKFAKRTDIESAPDNATNPEKTGATPGASIPFTHAPHLCTLDTNHEWAGTHVQYDDGKMDGFVETNEGWDATKLPPTSDPALSKGDRAMYYYDERDIPFYYNLASTFAIADHYHASVLGPTWPNRMYLLASTSYGLTFNGFPDISTLLFPDKDSSILDELEKRHVSWNLYGDGAPGAGVIYNVTFLSRWGHPVKLPYADFISSATGGTLPQVSFLDAHIGAEGPDQNDEHPPADIQVGQKFVSDVVHALMKSPKWAHTALFLTWDEHGGFYDHVAPPAACAPDGAPVQYEPGDTTGGKFDRLGVRVPFILVSPYAKPGYVGHTVYDHSSIARFIQTKFKLPALTARDANADPLMDMFDFSSPKLLTPPNLPEPTIDQAELDYCKKTYAKQ
jgi:phospholipase C